MLNDSVSQAQDNATAYVANETNTLLLAQPNNLTLPDDALVLFDANGTASLAKPASIEGVGTPVFPVIVDGWPTANVASVQIASNGVVLGQASVGMVEDGVPATAVKVDNIPSVAANSYVVQLVDPVGNILYQSPPLQLWQPSSSVDLGQTTGFLTSCVTHGCFLTGGGYKTLEHQLPIMQPDSGSSGCRPTSTYTYATNSPWNWQYNTYGNSINVNDASLTSAAFTRYWSWGTRDDCGNTYPVGSTPSWGHSDSHSGKSDTVGSGGFTYGFTQSYGGSSYAMQPNHYGGSTYWTGYETFVSDGQSFMKTPSGVPVSWDGLHHVSIPSSSSSAFSPTALAKLALSGLSKAIGGWGGAIASVLGFVIPSKVYTVDNWQEITGGVGGAPGGGIHVYTGGRSDGKPVVVSGEMIWQFKQIQGTINYYWDMQGSVGVYSHFNGCTRSNCWYDNPYTAYYDIYHAAKARDR